MSSLFRKLSIHHKLIASMGACLLLFVLISGGLSFWLIGRAVSDRVVGEELPTIVNAIRADVQRQIAEPL
ncbi:MAG: methyl-accepting chemotaxis protein, partial [Rubrivivax sp.]